MECKESTISHDLLELNLIGFQLDLTSALDRTKWDMVVSICFKMFQAFFECSSFTTIFFIECSPLFEKISHYH